MPMRRSAAVAQPHLPGRTAFRRGEPPDHAEPGCGKCHLQRSQDRRGQGISVGPILLGAAKPVPLTPTATVEGDREYDRADGRGRWISSASRLIGSL